MSKIIRPTKKVIVITGALATGKTVLADMLATHFRREGKQVALNEQALFEGGLILQDELAKNMEAFRDQLPHAFIQACENLTIDTRNRMLNRMIVQMTRSALDTDVSIMCANLKTIDKESGFVPVLVRQLAHHLEEPAELTCVHIRIEPGLCIRRVSEHKNDYGQLSPQEAQALYAEAKSFRPRGPLYEPDAAKNIETVWLEADDTRSPKEMLEQCLYYMEKQPGMIVRPVQPKPSVVPPLIPTGTSVGRGLLRVFVKPPAPGCGCSNG